MCMYNYTCSDYVTTETLIQIVHKHASTLDTDHGFVDWLKVYIAVRLGSVLGLSQPGFPVGQNGHYTCPSQSMYAM